MTVKLADTVGWTSCYIRGIKACNKWPKAAYGYFPSCRIYWYMEEIVLKSQKTYHLGCLKISDWDAGMMNI
jgi:hypothetical protein